MKWSMPLLVASMGTRATADQLVPVALSEWLSTRSLARQERREWESARVAETLTAAAAGGPGDVDRSGAVDLGRWKRSLAQAAGHGVVADRGDRGRRAPAGAAVGGVQRADGRLVRVGDRHDHDAVGAHDRLAADDAAVVG